MSNAFLQISNAQKVSRKEIPQLAFDEFRRQVFDMVIDGAKVVQYFVYPDKNRLKLLAVLRTDKLFVAGCDVPEPYPSFSRMCEPFHLFEREMAEQYGIHPQGHPWLKMVRYHPNYTDGAADVFGNDYTQEIPGNYKYYQVEGDEIHEVAVGPVHAGVIEPGHFRFNCIGERVLHLEIQLGYQHRGIEKQLTEVPDKRLPILGENIAGDTTIGHSLCMAQNLETLTAVKPDQGARVIRTIALELERLANHIGDLGALSGDVAFLPPANYFGRIRGDFLNLSLLICGNRFGKGLVRPGGVRFSLSNEIRRVLNDRLAELRPEVTHVLELLFNAVTVRARFEGCGAVSHEDAEHLGLVGPAGRASGMAYDVRRCFPTEHYPHIDIPKNKKATGDVYARARVRYDEIHQSLQIIESLAAIPVETRCVSDGMAYDLPASSFSVALNEAWRGEVSHAVLTDENGKILRYKIKDPSFHNWNGLAMALRDTGISDFPLNNKSFNLSYCGFDL
ncbi:MULTISPECIES: NADH-quinone oxidoreductase subunit C [Desulfobacter]|jgi:Ni,Fe-hydrogenase III large subunit|uniref:hydrogenase large subunit n=1 Tax=Desulfobacter TaxID=2289 RepID=UPI001B5C6517|nr:MULTISPECIES: NADH-quinone oxidoreductase subunit C [Desulfobacter]MBP8829406.1 NADH-quinone oxidoreductase subunit C [Desulfobacter sp.]MDX9963566.1 hydrogenase [Desulfobacter postgatei]